VVHLTLTASEDVDSVDVPAIRAELLSLAPSAESVRLSIQAGSVTIAAVFIMSSADDAAETVHTLQAVPITALSALLRLQVLSIDSIESGLEVVVNMSPSPPASLPSQPEMLQTPDMVVTIALVAAGSIGCGVALLLGSYLRALYRRCCQPRRPPYASSTFASSSSATSATMSSIDIEMSGARPWQHSSGTSPLGWRRGSNSFQQLDEDTGTVPLPTLNPLSLSR
jgi:hypothetical protein